MNLAVSFALVTGQIYDILYLQPQNVMSRICAITGKRPKVGGRIIHKGVSKKAGGIGLQLVKNNKRTFRPNLQRVRVKLPTGQVKRLWVSVKAIKAGKIQKA
jgi:large subunit ribosomal protein L28